MVNAVGYVRCSTEQQEDSPEQQKKAILEFAKVNGYDVQEWFTDFGKSGTTFELRPEFQRLRKVVEGRPAFRAVICYDESRWGRAIDSRENGYWRIHFQLRGVELVLVKTSIDPKNEYSPVMQTIESIQASQYSKKLSELTQRGAMNNKGYSNGGTAPYGYKRVAINSSTGTKRYLEQGERSVPKQEKVKFELGDPNEVEIVKTIFKLRLEGRGYVRIAEALNRQEVPCPKRGRWNTKDQKWAGVTIRTILSNPAYYGAMAYNRLSMSKIIAQREGKHVKSSLNRPHFQNEQEKWIVEKNAHPAIVSQETWMQVNNNLLRPAVKPNQYSQKSEYLLTGLMKCSKCGFAYQGRTTSRKGYHYNKYVCGGYKNKGVCDFCAFHAEPLERYAIEIVQETLEESLVTGKITFFLELLMDVNPEQKKAINNHLKKTLEENEQKQKNLANAISLTENGIAIKALVDKLAELELEAKGLTKQSELERQSDALSLEMVFQEDTVVEFIGSFRDEIKQAPPDVRKAMLKKCISEIIVDREHEEICFQIRRIPAVTPELERQFTKHKPLTISLANVVTAECSGGTL